jgi:hypothetical protein
VVVTQYLSEEMRNAGASLISRLDEVGLLVRAALWRYHEEGEVWRLVIALPGIDLRGPRKAYEQIQSVLLGTQEGEPTIGLENISVVDAEGTLISELRNWAIVKIRDTVLGVPLGRMVGRDAFIYRL